MIGSDSERIAGHLRDEAAVLDALFGAGRYIIEAPDWYRCVVRSDWLGITFAYEPRDRWVVSLIEPLSLPEELRDQIPSHLWHPFAGHAASIQSKGPLDAERVRAGLLLVEQIARAELDAPGTLRDWVFFTWGYNCCYTDRVSADFRDRWRLQLAGRLIGRDGSERGEL